jgi:hypothetical protein
MSKTLFTGLGDPKGVASVSVFFFQKRSPSPVGDGRILLTQIIYIRNSFEEGREPSLVFFKEKESRIRALFFS